MVLTTNDIAILGNFILTPFIEKVTKTDQLIELGSPDNDAYHLNFIPDDVVDAFSILGPVEELIKKLKELEKI